MKAMGGGGGSFSQSTKKYVAPPTQKVTRKAKQLSHSELAIQWQQNGGKFVEPEKKAWTKADIDRARAAKERAEEAAEKAAKEAVHGVPTDAGVEIEPVDSAGSKCSDLARARMTALAAKLQEMSMEPTATASPPPPAAATDASVEELRTLVECRRSQLQELELLEAMFIDELLFNDPAGVAALRELVEALDDDDDDDPEALRAVAMHPPLGFTLQMTVPDSRAPVDEVSSAEGGADGGEGGSSDGTKPEQRLKVASLLLRVGFPPSYPTQGTPPLLFIEDVMIVDADAELASDKTLQTLATLEEDRLIAAMTAQAAEHQPDPCIFEMATWATEHAFEFVRVIWSAS